jgi:chromosome partition protein MukF
VTRPRDPASLIGALAADKASIQLRTEDLCFAAALYLRADRASLASFDEPDLIDIFEQVCDVVDPGADNPRLRATHAIQRLRDNRLLSRVDGAGIARTGEYALTRLAAGIVGFFLEEDALTRESLTLLTRTLIANLAHIVSIAKHADTPEIWHGEVVGPLRVTVGDLIAGIERRQRGLDTQQEELQRQTAALVQEEWFSSVTRCEELLDTMTGTLRELNEVIMRDCHQLVTLLQEIRELAEIADAGEAIDAAQRVIEHVDRVAEWGRSRQRAWSDYYQFVHRYLRDVVRLDPDRALSHRLRTQIEGFLDQPFALVVADTQKMTVLREIETEAARTPARQKQRQRESELEEVAARDREAELEALVVAALGKAPADLASVVRAVLPILPADRRFAAIGKIAAIVARRARTHSARERSWTLVDDGVEAEDWSLTT